MTVQPVEHLVVEEVQQQLRMKNAHTARRLMAAGDIASITRSAVAGSPRRPTSTPTSTGSARSAKSGACRRTGAAAAAPRRPPGAVTPLTRAGSGQTCKRPASTAKPSGATHNNEGVYR